MQVDSWRSIDENEEQVRVLRGILATRPVSFDRVEALRPARTFPERMYDLLHRFSAFAFSAVLHVLVLVLLAEFVYIAIPVIEETLLSVSLHRPSPKPEMAAPDPGEKERREEAKFERAVEAPKTAEAPAPAQAPPARVIGSGTTDAAARPEPVGVIESASDLRDSDLLHLTGSGVYNHRSGTGRRAAIGRYGGTEGSEAAVELGLRWLAAHQSDDGRWSASQFNKQCPKGEMCGRSRGPEGYDAGVTGLALLAFLGAGYTHKQGAYRETVDRAIRWLVTRQDPKGFFFDSTTVRNLPGGMYGHGVCTFALGEACAMTEDASLKPVLERAVKATESSQQAPGGWYYTTDPNDRASELTLSVWHMMGLQAAKKSGVPVPEPAVKKAMAYVRDSTDLSGGVYYSHRSNITLGATGAGLFARCMFGMTEGNWLEKGVAYIDQQPEVQPSLQREQKWEYIYCWYYRTLVGFQLQGRHWRDWNRKLRPFLVATQRSAGHGAGAWNTVDYADAGTVYSTAMCVLMLETYYRYLPMVSDRSGLEGVVDGLVDEPMTGEEQRRAEMAKPPAPEDVATRAERELQQARARVKSGTPEERYMGARRLSELGDRGSVADLIAAAEKAPVARLRAAHLQFVGKLKAEEAIPFLIRSLDDADETVRAAAVSALLNTTGVYIAEPEGWKRWYADRQGRRK